MYDIELENGSMVYPTQMYALLLLGYTNFCGYKRNCCYDCMLCITLPPQWHLQDLHLQTILLNVMHTYDIRLLCVLLNMVFK